MLLVLRSNLIGWVLIVGSPTRAFNPTKEISTFLKKIPPKGLKGVKVASFDTRLSPSDVDSRVYSVLERRFGYAAEPIADKLKKSGGELIVQPEGFFVKDSKGPLKEGELERAAEWAKLIMKTQWARSAKVDMETSVGDSTIGLLSSKNCNN